MKPSMDEDRYFVEVQHRPRRVAFLVDLDQDCDAIFNEIVDFSLSSWGGRHNPIIPVLQGRISEPYWQLLKLMDPDALYTYAQLASGVVRQILTELRPLEIIQHRKSLLPEGRQFTVRIDHQASVLPVLKRITEQVPVWRKPDPAVLVFDYREISRLSPFVRRNFGGNTDLHIWCRDYSIPCTTVAAEDKEVMKALADNRSLMLPIHISGDAPIKLRASTSDWGTALTLCYGNSPWNFVEYWNHVHFQDGPFDGLRSLSELWMPPAVLEDRSFYDALLKLIRHRTFCGQHQSHLRVISYDESTDRMRELTKQICTDFKWNLYPSEPILRHRDEIPA